VILPQRKHPVHMPVVVRHNEPTVVLLTVCTSERKNRLANERVHRALKTVWTEAHAWRVGLYVIMPDHVHMFCSPGCPEFPAIASWARYWKSLTSKAMGWGSAMWQLDCWDTQMRSPEHYHGKREYVRQNPVRKGLVPVPKEWPFTGVMEPIEW